MLKAFTIMHTISNKMRFVF
jgi:hypothetical protein